MEMNVLRDLCLVVLGKENVGPLRGDESSIPNITSSSTIPVQSKAPQPGLQE